MIGCQQVGLVQDHQIGGAELLLEQLLERAVVIERGIGGALRLEAAEALANNPSRTAAASTTAITPSTVTRVQISGH